MNGASPSEKSLINIATKYKIVEKIINTEDEAPLKEVNALLNMADTDFWHEVPASTRESIQRGLEDTKRERTRPHQEVTNEIRARFATWKTIPYSGQQKPKLLMLKYCPFWKSVDRSSSCFVLWKEVSK